MKVIHVVVGTLWGLAGVALLVGLVLEASIRSANPADLLMLIMVTLLILFVVFTGYSVVRERRWAFWVVRLIAVVVGLWSLSYTLMCAIEWEVCAFLYLSILTTLGLLVSE